MILLILSLFHFANAQVPLNSVDQGTRPWVVSGAATVETINNLSTSNTAIITSSTIAIQNTITSATTSLITNTNGGLAKTQIYFESGVVSATNRLPIEIGGRNPDGVMIAGKSSGIISSNSSSTPLGANASFIGTYFDITNYASITILTRADQMSAVNGVKVEFSHDCSTVSRTLSTTLIASTDAFFFNIPREAKCFRIEYTNGAIAQTSFFIQVLGNTVDIGSTQVPIISPINDSTSTDISRSILTSKQENGTYANVGSSNSGGLKVAVTDRPSEVRNRVKVEKRIFRTSLTASMTTVHTVTASKTLYVTGFISSSVNNANDIGEWRVSDGVTDKFGFVTGEKVTGGVAPSNSTSPDLPEPIPFTSAVNLYEVSGDMQVSFWLIGYEE